jgi:AraC-like DNA-binding protein
MNKRQPISECFHFAYTDIAADSLLSALERHSIGKYEKGIFRISPSIGEGNIHVIEIEEGLFLRCFHFRPNLDIHFQTKAPSSKHRLYHLHFFLDKTSKAFSSDILPSQFKIAGNSIFQANNMDVEGCFKKGHTIKIINLVFSPSWLEKNNILMESPVKTFFDAIDTGNGWSQLLNSMAIFDYNAASQIHESVQTEKDVALKTRINCLLLVNRFFNSISARKNLSPRPSNSTHFSDIAKIEAHVREHLDSGLPQLKNLAIQFHMSASTLKRHFKAVYGKNIYEYYLEKKMDLARNLLLKEGLSISQVAYTLGYEKAGSLTAAFKKVHGHLPRELKNCL